MTIFDQFFLRIGVATTVYVICKWVDAGCPMNPLPALERLARAEREAMGL